MTQSLIDGGMNPETARATASLIALGAAATAGGAAGGGMQGATTAANIDLNNRQLHPVETKRIQGLAQGDPQKEARLIEAACALVRCADGVPTDDPNYSYLKALQDAGGNLAAEQKLLLQQSSRPGDLTRTFGPLFRYSWVDEYLLDPASQNNIGTRLAGAAQGGVGIAGVIGSGALCTTGWGCAAGAFTGTISADYAQAGIRQSITGNATAPYGEQVLQSLGLNPQAAAITYGVLGIGPAAAPAIAQTFVKVAPQLDAHLLNAGTKIGQNIDDVAVSLARNSTHSAGNADRVVLGKWEGDYAGYVGEAKLNGGTWYQTNTGVFERMTAGLSQVEKEAVAWKVNEAFLKQQLQAGVAKFEFTGEPIANTLANPLSSNSFRAYEIRFLMENAPKWGYVRNGNVWIKR